ncbi:hypothetical protein ABCY62_10900 [Acetivibrio clariflavus]|uniref:hypothetical protein n=1 Tax=Acetivibrio clariflavus TaxID=288965 RepID=UPI0031F5818E
MQYKLETFLDERFNDLRASLPDGLSVLEEYLETAIINDSHKKILFQKIELVKSGQVNEEVWGSDSFVARIKSDTVTVYNTIMERMIEQGLTGKDKVPQDQERVTIDLNSFCEIVEAWIIALKEFYEKRNT